MDNSTSPTKYLETKDHPHVSADHTASMLQETQAQTEHHSMSSADVMWWIVTKKILGSQQNSNPCHRQSMLHF